MKSYRPSRWFSVPFATVMLAAVAACASEPTPEEGGGSPEQGPPLGSAAQFYNGKTLTIIVPYNPGGGFDTFIRTLEPMLEDELDGVEVQVENLPGGGGLIGANETFQAEPDGLTIGLINYPGAVFAEITEQEGVALDNQEWTFLARLAAINPLVYTGADSGYESFDDILNAEEPVVFGIGGVGSDAYYAISVISQLLEFPNRIVGGYPGDDEAAAALIAGEVDASVRSADAALQTVESSGGHPVLLIGTEPNESAPDVPLVVEYGTAEQQEVLRALASVYDLERVLVGPPGIDEEKAEYLADAIHRAATDPAYGEQMEAANYSVNPLSRDETVRLAEAAAPSVELLAPVLE